MTHFTPSWLPADGSGVRAFLSVVEAAVPAYFAPDQPIHVARAPGRLDVMGGIADYSGSLVLQMPLAEAAIAAVQARDDDAVHVFSPSPDRSRSSHVALRLSDLGLPDQPVAYARARDAFAGVPRDRWAAHVVGALLVLARECGARFDRGLALLLRSDVPEGKGVASSAAVQVAAMRAVAAHLGLELDGRRLALLCQRVENEVAGAPCGVMDQMTAACGAAGQLLALRCQPCELEGQVPLPEDLEVLGLDSGVRHAVSGSDYTAVRVGTFVGYRMLADLRGLAVRTEGERMVLDDPEWRDHLANCDPDEFRRRFEPALPERIDGAAFLARYGGTTDRQTVVDPAQSYAVRAPVRHAVDESRRVERFRELLTGAAEPGQAAALGDLMFASHAGYTDCGLGNEHTDWIVARVRAAREQGKGLWGARVTGGGCGGTVAILGQRGRGWLELLRIKRDLAARTGHAPHLFRWSSDGAMPFGTVLLTPRR